MNTQAGTRGPAARWKAMRRRNKIATIVFWALALYFLVVLLTQ